MCSQGNNPTTSSDADGGRKHASNVPPMSAVPFGSGEAAGDSASSSAPPPPPPQPLQQPQQPQDAASSGVATPAPPHSPPGQQPQPPPQRMLSLAALQREEGKWVPAAPPSPFARASGPAATAAAEEARRPGAAPLGLRRTSSDVGSTPEDAAGSVAPPCSPAAAGTPRQSSGEAAALALIQQHSDMLPSHLVRQQPLQEAGSFT